MKFFLVCILLCMWVTPLVFAEDSSVMISEFLPNPIGDDATGEWIELYNSGSAAMSLNGWVVSDVYGTVKNFSLTGKQIEAGEFLLIYRSESQITMNNDTEQIRLVSPGGWSTETAVVSNPVEGKSYTNIAGMWSATAPTPGSPYLPPPSPSPSPHVSPTVAPSPTLLPSPTPSLPTVTIQNIVLSEVLACGSTTEWVEVYNPNATQVFLDGWKIQDSTSQSKTFEGMSIAPQSYLVKEWAGYFLNNGGDEVRLFHGDDLVDSFSYETCSTGYTWAKHGEEWKLTLTITKGTPNEFPEVVLPSPIPSPQSTAVPVGSYIATQSSVLSVQAKLPSLPDVELPTTLATQLKQEAHPSFTPRVSIKTQPRPSTAASSPPVFPWFISAGFWLCASACTLIKNATINHALVPS